MGSSGSSPLMVDCTALIPLRTGIKNFQPIVFKASIPVEGIRLLSEGVEGIRLLSATHTVSKSKRIRAIERIRAIASN